MLSVAPSPPLSLVSSTVSYVTMTVEWMPPAHHNGIINEYLITYWKDESNKSNITVPVDLSDDLLKRTIYDLVPSTNYSVEVRARNSGGFGDPSMINIITRSIG